MEMPNSKIYARSLLYEFLDRKPGWRFTCRLTFTWKQNHQFKQTKMMIWHIILFVEICATERFACMGAMWNATSIINRSTNWPRRWRAGQRKHPVSLKAQYDRAPTVKTAWGVMQGRRMDIYLIDAASHSNVNWSTLSLIHSHSRTCAQYPVSCTLDLWFWDVWL